MIGNEKLLCRPSPFADESMIGYLLRLTEENGYESISWMLQMAELKNYAGGTYSFIYGQSDLSAAATLAGLEIHLLNRMTYKPVSVKTERFHGIYEIFGQCISSSIIRHKTPKICPLCLAENGYCRKVWELAVITACPFHQCLLISNCSKCGKRISWNRQEVCRCKCGFDLRKSSIVQVPDSEMIVANRFYSLFGLKPEEGGFPALLENLSAGQLASLLFLFIGQHYKTTDTTGKVVCKKLGNEEMHRKLNEAVQIFNDYPKNFFVFLDNKLRADETQTAVKRKYKTSKRRLAFGGFYRAITIQLADPQFDFLREAFNNFYEREKLLKNGFKIESEDANFIKTVSESYISVSAAAEILSLTEPTIIRLLSENALTFIESETKETRQKYLIERASVIELKNKRKDFTLLADVNKTLNTHFHQTKQLIQAGLLKIITSKHGFSATSVVFDRRDVQSILDRLKRNSINNSAGDNDKSINLNKTLVRLGKYGFNFGALINLVFQGKLRPIGKSSAGGVHGYHFNESDINRFIISITESNLKETFSLEETWACLELNKRSVLWLYRNNFLSGKRFKGNINNSLRFDQRSVLDFKKDFVLATELFEDRKITQKRIVKILAEKQIFPVNGNNAEYYVFEKKAVKNIQIKNSRIKAELLLYNVEEASETLNISSREINVLVENGTLKPYPFAKNKGLRFSSYIIQKVQQLGLVNLNIYSTNRAAGILRMPAHVFLSKYVKTGRIKPASNFGKREYYFWKDEIQALAKLENSRITTAEAAKILRVNISCIHKLIAVGEIVPVSGPKVDGYPINAYSRKEVETLCKTRNAFKAGQIKSGKSGRFGR